LKAVNKSWEVVIPWVFLFFILPFLLYTSLENLKHKIFFCVIYTQYLIVIVGTLTVFNNSW
jgi:hypothetical protein